MTGLHISSCNKLYCIEEFRCCHFAIEEGKSRRRKTVVKIFIRVQNSIIYPLKILSMSVFPADLTLKTLNDYVGR